MASLQAQYFGMISEVDAQLGRVWEHLRGRGVWDDTVVVVTADHGEQLGDQGLLQKLAFFDSSYAILGIMTWLVAIGAVIILGAVAGAVWEDRKGQRAPEPARDGP